MNFETSVGAVVTLRREHTTAGADSDVIQSKPTMDVGASTPRRGGLTAREKLAIRRWEGNFSQVVGR